ncbi:hypothetical protein BGZ96_005071, partial [Linnemannia gamsii]
MDLKDAVVAKKPDAFGHVTVKDMALWRFTIPVVTGNIHKPVFLDEVDHKMKRVPTDKMSELFKKKTLRRNSIRTTIKRPKGTFRLNPGFSFKYNTHTRNGGKGGRNA